jgi:hypothetical protein
MLLIKDAFSESGNSKSKAVELVKINGKYYLELESLEDSHLENSQHLAELIIALAQENEVLRERMEVLEARLRAWE